MEHQERQLREEHKLLKQKLEDPAIYSSKEYPGLARRQAELEKVITLFDENQTLKDELRQARDLFDSRDPDLNVLAMAEVDSLKAKLANNEVLLNEALLTRDPSRGFP